MKVSDITLKKNHASVEYEPTVVDDYGNNTILQDK